MVTVTLDPACSEGTVQAALVPFVPVLAVEVHVPELVLALTKVVPFGIFPVTTIPVARSGPLLVTV